MTPTETPECKRWVPEATVLCAWAALLVVFVATYYFTFAWLARMWMQPNYLHGFLVAPFSLFLLWFRSDMMVPFPSKGSLWAFPFFALSAVIRGIAIYFNYSIDHYSLFPLLIGLALFVGGWRALRWSWPAIMFLVFMIPLPGFLEGALSRPLQYIGTNCSIYVIQTLGIPAVAVGNRIMLSAQALEVADACNGIKMLMLFFAICVGATLVMPLKLWEKCVIAASAIPIAVLSNVARITVSAVVSDLFGPKVEQLVHDYGGPAMMPLAIVLVWGEMQLIWMLLVEPPLAPLVLSDSPTSMKGGSVQVVS